MSGKTKNGKEKFVDELTYLVGFQGRGISNRKTNGFDVILLEINVSLHSDQRDITTQRRCSISGWKVDTFDWNILVRVRADVLCTILIVAVLLLGKIVLSHSDIG